MIFKPARRLKRDEAIDLNFALIGGDGAVATLHSEDGLMLALHSDQPGLQVYTGAGLSPHATPLTGQTHSAFAGIALEPQGFPDALNQPQFPSILCTPEQP